MTKRSTKRALALSFVSLLLCVSMFVGTTFAWFTDSVSSTNNIITAGNLDVELEYFVDGKWVAVDENTNVFEENTLWEPGHTEVVYLKVSNVGTLALKYALNINIVKETYSINVEGDELRLSDYIMVDVIEGVTTPFASREAALKAAADDTSFTADTMKTVNADKTGELYPVGDATGSSEEYVALVVYMPHTVGNEANYAKGEVAPEIYLGINLMATQFTYEEDSFNNMYDETAKVDGVPMASVTNMAVMPEVTTNKATYTLNTAYIFDATEDYDAAQLNAHRYWHADFVAYFDKDVDGADVGLAGQYDAFSTDWLAFELDGLQIKANTPVRMLINEDIGTNFPINYEELCGIVKSFKCGAFAVDPAAMAGKTMTVELRLYETTADPSTGSGDKNVETSKYITIGTYSYTFPALKVADQTTLDNAVIAGVLDIELAPGTYTFPSSKLKAGQTLTCQPGTVFDGKTGLNVNGATVVGATFTNDNDYLVNSNTINGTFKDCVFTDCDGLRYCYAGETVVFENCVFDTDFYGVHFDGGANDVVFKNCTFSGFNTVGSAVTKLTMEDCTFKYNGKGGYNGINLWGNSELTNCTFVFDGSASYQWVDLCGNNKTCTFTGCVISDGTTERALTASDVGDYGTGNTITIK